MSVGREQAKLLLHRTKTLNQCRVIVMLETQGHTKGEQNGQDNLIQRGRSCSICHCIVSRNPSCSLTTDSLSSTFLARVISDRRTDGLSPGDGRYEIETIGRLVIRETGVGMGYRYRHTLF